MILIWTHSLQRIVDFNKHSLQYSQRSWSCLCSCSWGPHSYWKIQLIINDHDHQNLPLVYLHHPGDEPLYHVHLPLPRSPEKIFPSLTQHQISQKFQHIDNYRKGKLLYILDTSPGLDWNAQKLQIWFCLSHFFSETEVLHAWQNLGQPSLLIFSVSATITVRKGVCRRITSNFDQLTHCSY